MNTNNKNNKFLYPKGSEWRKWDLHVHTKSDSKYKFDNDGLIAHREQNDDEYSKVFIEHIYSIENLGAIAITDHDNGNWIDELLEANNNFISINGFKNKITIFPGVEIETGDGIHLLVIFNPETQLKEVKENFRKSNWKNTIEHFITVIKNQSNPSAKKTTEEILDEARKWDAVCIFAHVTNDKGFFKNSSGDRKIKIYQHSLTQIFQIPKEGINNAGYNNVLEGKDPNYGNKSVTKITASDARRLKNIATNNCWIKADPTFEGLKQIIYEPEERVYIGEEPPSKIEKDKIIKSITIYNSKKWFEDDKPIPINEGLVSIIGGKGTGKTAILDLIAYATKSYKCYEKDETKSKSFLKKAFKELNGTTIKVEWENGNIDEITISSKLEENIEGKVKYLPQDFIDQLCSETGKNELEEQIENVIFQKIPSEEKAGFTNFKDYKDNRLKVINEKKHRITKQIQEINLKIYEYKESIKSKDSKAKEIEKIESDIEKFEQERGKISENLKDSKEQEILKELNSLIEDKSSLEKKISALNIKLRKIEEIKNKIDEFLEDSEKFVKGLKEDFYQVEISQEHIEKIKAVLYPEDLKEILDLRKNKIEEEIREQKEKLSELDEKIKEVNGKITLEKSKQDKIKEINKSLSDLKKKKDSVNVDIKKIEEEEKKLPDLLDKRNNLFTDYFELIFKEKETLKKIYAPLEKLLKESGEENEKLFEFTVKFNFDLNMMAEEGHELIDLRADGIFRQTRPEVFKEKLRELNFNLDFERETISETDKEFVKIFLKNVEDLFTVNNKTINSQLKERYTEQDFFNWLYSTKYYSINYSIKFNGIEINNLSPGLKGVALLILFLKLDEDDKRPILIDQPEENLDNRSVYTSLTRYFREAKKRRQVIIATHNPNLVVNTDSEQVIVANFDKSLESQGSRISYVSGSLENTFKNTSAKNILEKQGIREHVCEILEGGEDAFKKRENRYQIR